MSENQLWYDFLAMSDPQPVTGSRRDLVAHVNQLARNLDIETFWLPAGVPMGGTSNPGARVAAAPPIESVADYYTWLHEFGHIVHGHWGQDANGVSPRVLQEETEAWQWALDSAIVAPDRGTAKKADHALWSYGRNLPPWEWPQQFAAMGAEMHELAGAA